MGVGFPGRLVALVRLRPPGGPALAKPASEQFDIGPRRAGFDDVVLFVGLARMLAFAGLDHVDLAAARRERARVLAANAEQNDLGHVAEVEADASAVGAAVFADLVPDDIGFI